MNSNSIYILCIIIIRLMMEEKKNELHPAIDRSVDLYYEMRASNDWMFVGALGISGDREAWQSVRLACQARTTSSPAVHDDYLSFEAYQETERENPVAVAWCTLCARSNIPRACYIALTFSSEGAHSTLDRLRSSLSTSLTIYGQESSECGPYLSHISSSVIAHHAIFTRQRRRRLSPVMRGNTSLRANARVTFHYIVNIVCNRIVRDADREISRQSFRFASRCLSSFSSADSMLSTTKDWQNWILQAVISFFASCN